MSNLNFDIDHASLREIDVLSILPQRPPMVMISRLIDIDASTTSTELDIKEDCIFVDRGVLSGEGLMENMAQTCAARIGYINKYILKKSIQIGVIGAIRDFQVYSNPHSATTIRTTVKVLEDVFGLMLAEGSIYAGEELLATAQIKIALKEDTVQ